MRGSEYQSSTWDASRVCKLALSHDDFDSSFNSAEACFKVAAGLGFTMDQIRSNAATSHYYFSASDSRFTQAPFSITRPIFRRLRIS